MNYIITEFDIENIESCPICDGSDVAPVARSKVLDIEYFRTSCCKECGFVFRDRRPKLDWFLKNWNLRDVSQVNDKFNFINEEIEEKRMQRYGDTARFFKKILSSRKIIDVGCGTGTGLKSFEDEGFEVTGIEPDPSRARIGRERYGVNIIETTLDDYDSESEAFDIVTCLHSLEHFHSPYKVMKSIARLVKEGGHVYIEVPDFMKFVTDWNDAIFLAHLNNFSENNLKLLGMRVGLRPIIRTFPNSLGITHLGIVFCKDNSVKYSKEKYLRSKAVHDQYQYALRVYRNGLDDSHLLKEEVAVFNVPFINDISLSYKASSETKTLVRDNYLQRSINYDNKDREFVISPPTEDEFIKMKNREKEQYYKNRIDADIVSTHKGSEILYEEY